MLLLDEPTNDLDVETLSSLEDALLDFPGCAVVTSHDRWFLDRVATHILAWEGDDEDPAQVVLVRGQLRVLRGEQDRAPRHRGRPPAPGHAPPPDPRLSRAARQRRTPGPDLHLGVAADEVVGDAFEDPADGGEVGLGHQVDEVVADALDVARRGPHQQVVALARSGWRRSRGRPRAASQRVTSRGLHPGDRVGHPAAAVRQRVGELRHPHLRRRARRAAPGSRTRSATGRTRGAGRRRDGRSSRVDAHHQGTPRALLAVVEPARVARHGHGGSLVADWRCTRSACAPGSSPCPGRRRRTW